MKYIIYSVLFITLLSCNKKEENNPIQKIEKVYIDDPLVYEVINAVLELPEITVDKPKYMLKTAFSLDFILEEQRKDFYNRVKEYFGDSDTLSINSQIELSKISYYKEGKINNVQLIDYDLTVIKNRNELDSLNETIKKYFPNVSISYPIFNKQRNVAHMSYSDDGSVKYFFIKKTDGKWEIITIYSETIVCY